MKIDRLNNENIDTFLDRSSLGTPELLGSVGQIVEEVRKSGDKALIDFTERFDGVTLKAESLRVSTEEIDEATSKISPEIISALKLAAERIATYHERQKVGSWSFEDNGATLGQRITPLKRVGVYVPGGRADYPSSVLMNVVPAIVAGVREIAICCPPNKKGQISPYVLAAASILGIDEIYRLGGAQAIAALAYGTETIDQVDKITGPGNIYVTLAKKLVVGQVGIDMLAGPSEVAIIADGLANPDFIAADMLAQAEHDPLATSILITTDEQIAKEAIASIEKQLEKLSRKDIAAQSLEENGKILLADNFETIIAYVNELAPEHLEIMTEDAENLVDKIENAGAIFLGKFCPEALGDYIAGSNHILPTGGTARFYSPLGVADFVKRSSILSFDEAAAGKLIDAGATIASVEGLDAHVKSLQIRKKGKK